MTYTPSQGDIVWLQLNPQSGHEQAGRRPALTISNTSYNQKVGLALFMPITSSQKGYPFEIPIQGEIISGVILCDQVKSLDFHARKTEFIEKAPSKTLKEVIETFSLLIKISPPS